MTKAGKKCNSWAKSNTHNTKTYPNGGLDENYCRNPNEKPDPFGIWCFVDDKDHKWEYCNGLPYEEEEVEAEAEPEAAPAPPKEVIYSFFGT